MEKYVSKYVSRNIDSLHPILFGIVRDCSTSMKDGIGGTTVSKADMTATIINGVIQELEGMASKSGTMKPYFYFAMVDYGGDKEVKVGFPSFPNSQIVGITDLSSSPIRRETRKKKEPDGVGGFIEIPVEFPIWIEPKANGNTPMMQGILEMANVVSEFINDHKDCHPPLIINITDGQPTGVSLTDVIEASKKITEQETDYGNVLFFNAHLIDTTTVPVLYPTI